MTRDDLLRTISAHLRKTKESPYAFGRRVMGDQTFLWKMKNSERQPRQATIAKIRSAIRRREERLEKLRAAHIRGVRL